MRPILAILAALITASCDDGSPPSQISENPTTPAPAPATTPQKTGRVTAIAFSDFYALQQKNAVLIYDVRPSFYHRLGHIPGAVSWPKSNYDDQVSIREIEIKNAITAGKPVVLYCTDLACPDALNVATSLSKRGHDIAILQGGYEAWKLVTQ